MRSLIDLFRGLQGLGNNTGDYKDMAMTLREGYGIPSVVARVSRVDWLRHAAALLSPGFWRGSLRPRPLIDWYCTVLAALTLFTATAEWQSELSASFLPSRRTN